MEEGWEGNGNLNTGKGIPESLGRREHSACGGPGGVSVGGT